jgi:hypothetical protein
MTQDRPLSAWLAEEKKPVYLYKVGLMMADGKELSRKGYKRVPAYFEFLPGFTLANASPVEFPESLEDWGEVYFFLIYEAISNKTATGDLIPPAFIPAHAHAFFKTGALRMEIT